MNQVFQDTGEHGHSAAEHLQSMGSETTCLIKSQTVVLKRRVGQNDIHDEDHTN